jgi:hypothetical protein
VHDVQQFLQHTTTKHFNVNFLLILRSVCCNLFNILYFFQFTKQDTGGPSTSTGTVSGGLPPLPKLPTILDEEESDIVFVKEERDDITTPPGKGKGKGKSSQPGELQAIQLQVIHF